MNPLKARGGRPRKPRRPAAERGPYTLVEPDTELQDRLDLQYHLLDKHGMTLQDDLGMGRLEAAHEWAHRFTKAQG